MNTEKAFDKIQYPSVMKTIDEPRIEGNILNQIEGIRENPQLWSCW